MFKRPALVSAVVALLFGLGCGGGGGSTTAPTPEKPVVTAPSIVTTGATKTATVPAQSGITFAWTITGGTFSGGGTAATGTSVTFVAGTPGTLQLSCTAANAAGATSDPGTSDVSVVAAPAITAFSAAKSPLTTGGSTTLAAAFTGGTGSVDGGVGSVTSGDTKSTGTLTADTTFTLTVTNAAGDSVTRQATVVVVAAPSITSFTAANSPVVEGASASLTGAFSGGTGSVDHLVGDVTAGVAKATGAVTVSTTFTLTVTNAAGDAETATATVDIVPAASVITFTTEGDAFDPAIAVTGSPDIVWYFEDGTNVVGTIVGGTSTLDKTWATAATRKVSLSVTPWSSVTRINIGFDPYNVSGPSGDIVAGIETLVAQQVSNVENLQLVKSSLVQWSSDSTEVRGALPADPTVWTPNTIPALDFTDFVSLQTIEAHQVAFDLDPRVDELQTLTLANNPELLRVDVDSATKLTALDLSASPQLQDLRAAHTHSLTTLSYPATAADAWHVVTADSLVLGNQNLYQDVGTLFPSIAELWVSSSNQTGAFTISSTHPSRPVEIEIQGCATPGAGCNSYTSLTVAPGALQNTSQSGSILASNLSLASVSIDGAAEQITKLELSNNLLDQASVDGVLTTLDGFANSPITPTVRGTLKLDGNACPSATTGWPAIDSLSAKGWDITPGCTDPR